jgi:hypothetical protein
MKAWFVWGSPDYDWGDYVHGETRGKAKAMFWKEWSFETDEWIHMRVSRCPALDDIPITSDNIKKRTNAYMDEPKEYWYWHPICDCEICV